MAQDGIVVYNELLVESRPRLDFHNLGYASDDGYATTRMVPASAIQQSTRLINGGGALRTGFGVTCPRKIVTAMLWWKRGQSVALYNFLAKCHGYLASPIAARLRDEFAQPWYEANPPSAAINGWVMTGMRAKDERPFACYGRESGLQGWGQEYEFEFEQQVTQIDLEGGG